MRKLLKILKQNLIFDSLSKGMGFTNEVYVSRLYRDLRLWSIGGGADEVMLGIISKMMGIRPSGN